MTDSYTPGLIGRLFFFTHSWSVKKRLLSGFGIVLMLMTSLTLTGVYDVMNIDKQMAVINDNHGNKMRHAIDWRGSVHDQAIAARDLVLHNNIEGKELALDDIARLRKAYQQASQKMDVLLERPDINLNPEEETTLAAIHDQAAVSAPTLDNVIQLIDDVRDNQAHHVLLTELAPAYTDWLGTINAFIDLQESLQGASTDEVREIASGFLSAMLAFCLIALIIGSIVALRITRYIISSLGAEPHEVRALAQQIGQGDLSASNSSLHQRDKNSIMACLIDVSHNLSQTIDDVRQTAQQVSHSSEEIATGNNDLSTRTDQQASAITQTASAMEELNSTVNQNSDNAQHAGEEARKAQSIASQGGEAVQGAVDTIRELSQSSQEISSIIATIDGIAFQTNILALNASVEAARAGEHGRGFAVVAQEVRNLAQRSKDAASEISKLITHNLERVKHGNQRADAAGKSMRDVEAAIERVASIMQEISHASEEQRQGVHEVSDAVHQMDQTTQQNASLVDQSSQVANDLRDQARELIQTMEKFKTQENLKSLQHNRR